MSAAEFEQSANGHSIERTIDPILNEALAALAHEDEANPDLDGERINLFRDALDRAKEANNVWPHAPQVVLAAVDRVLCYGEMPGTGYSRVVIPREVQLGCIRTRVDDAMDAGDKGTAMQWLNVLETLRSLPPAFPAPRNTPAGP